MDQSRSHKEQEVEVLYPYEMDDILENDFSDTIESPKREHKLLLPVIVFLLTIGIGGYFMLSSFGVFGVSKTLCIKQETYHHISIQDQYQLSFENNLLTSFTYEDKMQLSTPSSGTDRYEFENRKTMLAFQSNKMKSQPGVIVSSELVDTSYHLIVKVPLKKINNEMVSMVDNDDSMLELDMSKQDVLQVMTENGYHCQAE